MVKSKKDKQKKRGASLEDMFGDGASNKLASAGGWKTSVADMALDEEEPAQAPAAAAGDAAMGGAELLPQHKQKQRKKKQRGQRGAGPQAMIATDNDDALTEMDGGESVATGMTRASTRTTSVVPGLGVVVHSMKRGDHTARQKKRKIVKVKKALARLDKTGSKLDTRQQRKVSKLGLKHMY